MPRRHRLPCHLSMLLPVLLLLLCATLSAHAQRPELWFGPGDDLDVKGVIAHPQYAQLFAPNAPWPVGARHFDVLMIRAPWVLRTNTTNPGEVQQALRFIQAHRLKIAAPTVGVATDDCGAGAEGTMSARVMNVYPRDMKKLGFPLDYADMDEPLYYGHYWQGAPTACKYSIAETAKRTALSMKIVQQYYPDAKFVLIEPPLDTPNAPAELLQFLHALHDEGVPYPANFRFDVAWNRSHWKQSVPAYIRALNTLHIPYSFVSDAASGQIHGDPAWVESAKADTAAFEALIAQTVHQKPTQIVVQSWGPNPIRLLPETDPTTATGLLKWASDRYK